MRHFKRIVMKNKLYMEKLKLYILTHYIDEDSSYSVSSFEPISFESANEKNYRKTEKCKKGLIQCKKNHLLMILLIL